MKQTRRLLVFSRTRATAEAALERNADFLQALPWPASFQSVPDIAAQIHLTSCNHTMLRDVEADYIAFVDGAQPTPAMLGMLKRALPGVIAVVSMYSSQTDSEARPHGITPETPLCRQFPEKPVLLAP